MKTMAWNFGTVFLATLFLLVLCPYDGAFPQEETSSDAEAADENTSEEPFDEFGWEEVEDEPGESLSEDVFSIYGHLTNLFQSGFNSNDADGKVRSVYGNMLYLRLKGDWNPPSCLQQRLSWP